MSLSSPTKADLTELQDWLKDEKGGNCFQQDSEAFTWNDKDIAQKDLPVSSYFSLRKKIEEKGLFTSLLTWIARKPFHSCIGRRCGAGTIIDEESGLTSYAESRVVQAGTLITTVISSILPIVTILVLYKIQTPYGRIWASIGFTVAFSILLAIFSNARRVEILAATAT
jgi:hypothetical protein